MRITKSAWLAAACAAALLGGCHHGKKPAPTTDTSTAGDSSGTIPGETVKGPATPVTTAMETPNIEEPGAASPLKDVYFDFDRYEIRADQRPSLEGNSSWLNKNGGQNVLVEGHCDERGTEEYNLALGDRRANATRDYLKNLGIPAGRMSTISYGKAYPVDPRSNEDAWAKNRRAHFTLVTGKR